MSSPLARAAGFLLLALVAACRAAAPADELARAERRARRVIERATGAPLAALRLPAAGDLAAVPQDPRNPLTPEKIALGRRLFHEAGLSVATVDPSRRGSVSCATCHRAGAGFRAGQLQGLGEGGVGADGRSGLRLPAPGADLREVDAQGIRTPSVLNVAYQEVLHWNGQLGAGGANAGTEAHWTPGTPKAANALGYAGVEAQAIAGLAIHRMAITEALVESLGYRDDFDAAFGERAPERRYGPEAAGLAIAAYERTLLPTESPWQRWLRGEAAALTAQQLRGARLFYGRGACGGCHSGPAMTDGDFHVLGLADLWQADGHTVRASADMGVNLGRASFTHRDADLYAFKTPQLYNLADASHLGHGGSYDDPEAFVRHKLSAEPENARVGPGQLDEAYRPRRLSDGEVAALVAFLTEGLRDPRLARYAPVEGGIPDEALALRE